MAAFGNVLSLRNLNDAAGLRAALTPGKKLVIIGGGYVGLECAATARSLDVEVVLIERAPRLLERVASAAISAFLQSYHQSRGVVTRTKASSPFTTCVSGASSRWKLSILRRTSWRARR